MTSPVLVNIGCGKRFHSAWKNLDVRPADASVERWNVLNGLPFASDSVDAVYHSHVLEHLGRDDAKALLHECFRVLKPGGILRVVVPDLEGIARAYLNTLKEGDVRHEWMTIELVDQLTRHQSGGEMIRYCRQASGEERPFILQRLGEEAKAMMESPSTQKPRALPLMMKIKAAALRLLLGEKGMHALDLGKFRLAGEVHRWMYDKATLAARLTEAGFAQTRVCTAMESAIEGWSTYQLDAGTDGTPWKPDSLFMEAAKTIT